MSPRRKRRRSTSPSKLSDGAIQYDAELFELWVGKTLVKRLDVRASSQRLILTAFQEDNWAARIDNPLPPDGVDAKNRLREVVHRLNQHKFARIRIQFHCDGSGEGIRWELVRGRSVMDP